MSRWLVVIAGCAMWCLAMAQQPNPKEQGANASKGASEHANPPPKNNDTTPLPAVSEHAKGVGPPIEAEPTCTDPGGNNSRECQDLKAQQEMAKWAYWVLVATSAGAVVGAVAAGLVYATFKQTRTSAEKQLRAYALVKTVEMIPTKAEWPKMMTGVRVTIHNFGHVPATDIEFALNINTAAIDHAGEVPQNRFAVGAARQTCVIAPHDDYWIEADFPPLESGLHRLENGEWELFVTGHLTYNDGFKSGRATKFKFSRTGPNWLRPGELSVCDDGNDIT